MKRTLPTIATIGLPPRWETSVAADGWPVVTAWNNGQVDLLTMAEKTCTQPQPICPLRRQ